MHVRRLLLIDEDPEFQQLLEERLGPNGFEVVLPPDPTNPLGHVKDLRPALILIAVELPDKIGYALCNKAKKGLARDIPVILTTRSVPASGFRSHRKLKVHADEYIDKRSMTDEEVVDKVDHLVGLRAGYPPSASAEFEELDFEELDVADLADDAPLARALVSLDDEPEDDEISAVPRQIAHEGGPEFDPRELGADEDDDGSFEFGKPMRLGHELVVPLRGGRGAGNGGRASGLTAAGTDPGAHRPMSRAGAPTSSDADDDDSYEFGGDRTAVALPYTLGLDGPSPRGAAAGSVSPRPLRDGAPLRHLEPEPSAPVAALDLGLGLPGDATDDIDSPASLRIAELERERERLRDELDQARGDIDQMRSELVQTRADRDDTRTDLDQVRADLEELRGNLDQTRGALDQARGDLDEVRGELTQARGALEQTRSELDQARRAPAAAPVTPFSREREFLNLREVLNKKEKALLDLNDQIDGKERQILAEKDRVREAERVRSDLDAKNLELEQSLLAASEQLAELQSGRSELEAELGRQTAALAAMRGEAEQLAKLLDRERAAWRDERDDLVRRSAAALQEQQQRLDAERALAEATLRDKHGADLRGLKAAYDETSAEKDKGFGAAMALAEVRRQEEVSAAQRAADERLQHELADLRRRHQDEIEALRAEQAAELQHLVRQNQESRQALEDRHNGDVQRLEEEQTQALAAADKRRVGELADSEKRRAIELADSEKRRAIELSEAEERRRRDLAAADEAHVRATAELEAKFDIARAEAARQWAAERKELEARLTARVEELREREGALSSARDALETREQTIGSLHRVLAERDERITGQKQELDELERQNTGYQEQVLRAFQKIKADEAIVARAKKALAIALTLLDDADPAGPSETAREE